MSQGLYTIITRAPGTLLTAAIYNADHQTHVINQNPQMTGGYSDDLTQMQLVTNPGTVGSESPSVSLAGELERIRYQLRAITGELHWYMPPAANLHNISFGGGIPLGSLVNTTQGGMLMRSSAGAGPWEDVRLTSLPVLGSPVGADKVLGQAAAGGSPVGISLTSISSLLMASPALTGNPTAPTPAPGDNDTSVATTAFVTAAVATAVPAPATATPIVEGVAAVGTSLKYAREDHVHPSFGGSGSTVYVSDTPPVGAPDNSLWWKSSEGRLYIRFNDGNTTQWVDAVATGLGPTASTSVRPQGRLTLTPNLPVLTASVSGAASVLYTPHVGLLVPIWDGSKLLAVTMGGELSQTLTDATKSPAAAIASRNYDVFFWLDGSTPRATRGPPWTSDTVRGTGAGSSELTRAGGILVNAQAITNGPAVLRGTYLGTVRTNASATIDFLFGGSAVGGSLLNMSVWNTYNRVRFSSLGRDSAASWTYNVSTPRPLNNSVANRANFLQGLQEDAASAHLYCSVTTSSAIGGSISIGENSTSVPTGVWGESPINTAGGSTLFQNVRHSSNLLGWNFFQALEYARASTSITLSENVATFYAGGLMLDWQG